MPKISPKCSVLSKSDCFIRVYSLYYGNCFIRVYQLTHTNMNYTLTLATKLCQHNQLVLTTLEALHTHTSMEAQQLMPTVQGVI